MIGDLAALPAPEQRRRLEALVLGEAGREDDAHRTFADLGLDSLAAVELHRRLTAATGLTLPVTVAFEYPSPAALAAYVQALIAGAPEQAPTVGGGPAGDKIAIIGLSIRLPGGIDDGDRFWTLLDDGGEVLSDFPKNRGWPAGLYDADPDHVGTTYARAGGFLHDADCFDARFFAISAREAVAMDPQQRLVLEGAWAALEDAGLPPDTLRGSRTGVFLGAEDHDYGPRVGSSPEHADGYLVTGTAASVLSGRVAYQFGLEGPNLTVDTACSASLVALHLAVQSLRRGESTLALAGGVAIMSSPSGLVSFSRNRAISPDGRCKAFSAGADGTGWSEGVALLVLEPLDLAIANGHRVLAVVHGTAINSDGASNGLTAPNGLAQERVIADALADAGLGPADVDVVETHGTGTPLGDPIEVRALQAAYGRDREHPLWIGSAKSNLGHTQAAAGVTGLIKMVLALRHEVLPRTLHVELPTPHVDWTATAVRLLTEARPWQRGDRPRLAGVSAFGMSGTNAHVIIGEPPRPEPVTCAVAGPVPWLLSAASENALTEQMARLRDHLESRPRLDPIAVAAALATKRTHLAYRAALVGSDRDDLLARPVTGTARCGALAFQFSGQGSEQFTMGRELYDRYPVYAAAFDEVSCHLDAHLDVRVHDIVFTTTGLLTSVAHIQPAVFALEVALYELVTSWGVRPDHLIGHSLGEIVAAYVAGVFSLTDAAILVTARGRLLEATLSAVAMAAVEATEDEVLPSLAGLGTLMSIAAVNGPRSVVLSGDAATVRAAAGRWKDAGRRVKLLAITRAGHSPMLDGMLTEFRWYTRILKYRPPRMSVISNVTGEPAGPELLCDPEYWVRQLRSTVRFEPGVRWLAEHGTTAFLELGPANVLSGMTAGCLDDRDDVTIVPLLPDPVRAVARLHTTGTPVDWTKFFGAVPEVPLPAYAFQHERFWLDATARQADAIALGLGRPGNPLLGAALELADDGGVVLTGRLSLTEQPWLADHRLGDTVVLPGTALADLVVAAADHVGSRVVEDLTLEVPLTIPVDTAVTVRVTAGHGLVTVDARTSGTWTRHATGTVADRPGPAPAPAPAWPPAGAVPLHPEALYADLAAAGLHYGPAFRGVRAAWAHGDDRYAEVVLPEGLDPAGHGVHPALLDAALHPIGADAGIPFHVAGLRIHAAGATGLRVRLRPGAGSWELTGWDGTGAPVVTADALTLRPVPSTGSGPSSDHVFEVRWQETTAEPALATPVVLTLPDPGAGLTPFLAEVAAELLTALTGDEPIVVPTHGLEPLTAAALRGLVRSAQAEHPGRIVLVDAGIPLPALPGDEPEIAVRGSATFVPRLVRVTAPPVAAPVLEAGGTVLVTGGVSGLGAIVARHLVTAYGVRHLVLAGRRGPGSPGATELTDELIRAGATVDVVACDVTDAAAVTALVAAIPALTAVVHAAGVLEDALLEATTPELLARVLGAKAQGARNLHEATRDLGLAAFILFSSASGTLASPGQAAYAAANAYLDELAVLRHAEGLPATSVAWGVWSEGAMTRRLTPFDRDRLVRSGMPELSTVQGLAALDRALTSGLPITVAIGLDPAALSRRPDLPALLLRLARRARPAARRAENVPIAAAPGQALDRASALGVVRDAVAQVLGRNAATVGAADMFKDLGFDSLLAVELRNTLTALIGRRLPATSVFDYPTPGQLAAFVQAELSGVPATAVVPAGPVAVTGDDPVVIVGMACRFPGGIGSPEDLWDRLAAGADVLGDFPGDRGWPLDRLFAGGDRPGSTYARRGGFLDGAADFDAGLFGISPREALAMDPQQRLLLESSWEVLERAGIDPLSLRGQPVGVFAGVMYHDWASRLAYVPPELERLLGNGSAGSVVSGRVAYTFGFEGPAVTVDTACSSSLVALHLAAQSLRSGESSLALAGGVTVMATPETFVEFSRQQGLAVDGRCKSYASAADGTALSEGVGVLLLERLSDARRNGHEVLAVLRGSAVNQDGASNGLTAPNGPSQQRVIRSALASAGLQPADVQVVEGHGTGTRLGDPIEAQALLATYGEVLLGSVKSNLGHTQAAAGVAGVIKMILAMRHGVVPATLHVDEPSDEVDWASGRVSLAVTAQAWPAGDVRRAGVSSFGISGTNAHVILEHAAPDEVPPPVEGPAMPWVWSARSPQALPARWELDADPRDVAWSLATTRAALPYRAAEFAGRRFTGHTEGTGRTAVIFAGQGGGALWADAADRLRVFPVFAEAFDAAHIAGDSPAVTSQSMLFAAQVGVFRLLWSWGVRPDVVAGHSLGEIVAAHVAGVLSLDTARALVVARAEAMDALSEPGVMMAIETAEPPALTGDVSVAAVNSGRQLVISGATDAVLAVAARYARSKRLDTTHAFHSPLMRPVAERLAKLSLTTSEPVIPVVSMLAGATGWDAAHWARHVVEPVGFAGTMRTVVGGGVTTVVETGDGVLSALLDRPGLAVPALRRGTPADEALPTALAALFVRGLDPHWPAVFGTPAPRKVALPTYAFQRSRYWLNVGAGEPGELGQTATGHPLWGTAVHLPDGGVLLTGRLSTAAQPWLGDHRAGGRVVLAGTALVEAAAHAGSLVGADIVDELVIHVPLALDAPADVRIMVTADHRIRVHSGQTGAWTLHAEGRLATGGTTCPDPSAGDPAWTAGEPLELGDFHATHGYGPAFHGLHAARRAGDDILAEVVLPDNVDGHGYRLHPALLDAALQTTFLSEDDGRALVPYLWESVVLLPSASRSVRIRLSRRGPGEYTATLTDPDGRLVAAIGSLRLRETATPVHDALFRSEWVPLAVPGDLPADPDVKIIELPGGDPVEAVIATVALLQQRIADPGLLVVVTRNAVATGPGAAPLDVAAAAALGIVRSAQAENPGTIVSVDVDGPVDPALLTAAVRSGETEIAVRCGVVLTRRLVRAEPPAALELPDRPWRLDVRPRGTLDNLSAVDVNDAAVAPGEVRIGLRVAALNFRDVMIALGEYPDDATLGCEGAGIVLETGAGVTGLAPGDRVLGLLDHGFATTTVAPRQHLTRVPDGWTLADAAAMPVAFLTAWYGLVHLAGLRRGDRVLVTSAAGGVGQAAVQIARHLGAEVFTTAATTKWPAVRNLGIADDHIADSRTTAFAAAFRATTAGHGMDVILQSAKGEFVDAALGLLADGGRLLEMGKADLRPARPGYLPYDLMQAGGDLIQRMLGELIGLFEQGALTPLPLTTWDARHARTALRHMSQGRHTGKLALTVARPLDPGGVVLITGGTGTLGGLLARHLIDRYGVRHLVVTGRTATVPDWAADVPAEVRVASCDVTDRYALAALLDGLDRPLTAVVHAAGIVEDGVLTTLTPDRVRRVLRPKVDGARNLHELTRDRDLAAFVLYSSAAATFGEAGQGAYSAANSHLDALAISRRAEGLPAVSLQWGAWAPESTMTADLSMVDRNRIERSGMRPLSAAEGLALFDAALATGLPVLAPMRLDLAAVRRLGDRAPRLLRDLVPDRAPAAAASEPWPGPGDLLAVVRAAAAAVLGHGAAASIGAGQAFKDLGFDSLTAVELRNHLAADTGLTLPASLIFDHPNAGLVAAYLEERLQPAAGPDPDEAGLRAALATIPLERFEQAGVLDVLRALAGLPAGAEADDLDLMSTDSLIRLALQDDA